MSGHLQHLAQLEQDLAKYRQQFQNSTEILVTLTEIKQDFATLSQYYQQRPITPEDGNNDQLAVNADATIAAAPPPEQLLMMQERLAYALVQLEHYVTEQALQSQDLVDQRLAAMEESVQNQMSTFRQHILLSLTQLDEKYEGYIDTQLAPLEAQQAVMQGNVTALEDLVVRHDDTLQDLQTCVSDRLETLHDNVTENQNTIQWFIVVGILLSIVFLLLPIGLQMRNELQFNQLQPPTTKPVP